MNLAKTRHLFAVLLAAVAVQTRAEWSFIKILRGEPEAPSYQRVAFVGSATVRKVEGQAERLCGIDRWSPVAIGSEVRPGDILRTGRGSVVLKMDNTDSFVRLTDNTVLRLVPEERLTPPALAAAR